MSEMKSVQQTTLYLRKTSVIYIAQIFLVIIVKCNKNHYQTMLGVFSGKYIADDFFTECTD